MVFFKLKTLKKQFVKEQAALLWSKTSSTCIHCDKFVNGSWISGSSRRVKETSRRRKNTLIAFLVKKCMISLNVFKFSEKKVRIPPQNDAIHHLLEHN